MKKLSLLIILVISGILSGNAQTFPYSDDFESYNAFTVPTGYTGDITVYLTHGTLNSKGLAGYLTSFTNSDSLLFPSIGPLSLFSVLEFDWRIMDPFLYPSTAATLAPGDSFNILISTDSVTWTSLFSINSSNFSGATTFENTILSLNSYSGQIIQLKVKGTRANGSSEFFIDIDNISVDVPGKINSISEISDFSLYPIPARNTIHFSNSFPITGTLQITDAIGKIVYEKVVQESFSGQLDIANLSPGNYNLIVKTRNENKICPLVIR